MEWPVPRRLAAVVMHQERIRNTFLDACWHDHDEPFEDIEDGIWEFYNANQGELSDLLHNHICENRDLFAAFATRE